MTKEALKLALEALEQTLQTLDDENAKPGGAIADTIWHSEHETLFDYLGSEITAIKEALAQPEQEPKHVATVAEVHMSRYTIEWTNGPLPERAQGFMPPHHSARLYATPPQRPWVGLTDDEWFEFWRVSQVADATEAEIDFNDFLIIALAVVAKLKEKNT